MRVIFFLLLLISFTSSAQEQSIYELDCRLPGPRNLRAKALVVLHSNYGGFARVVWYDSVRKEKVITDMVIPPEFTMNFTRDFYPIHGSPTDFQCLTALPQKNVLGKALFPADVFMLWFKYGNEGYAPYTGNLPRFDSSSSNGQDFYDRFYNTDNFPAFLGLKDKPNLTKVRSLTLGDLTCSLLSEYFTPAEQACSFQLMKNGLFGIHDRDRATLFCITVTNVDEPVIAKTTVKDRDIVDSFFRNAARMIPMNYERIRVEKSDFNSARLKSVIRSLPVGPNDAVVFAYSGHGFSYSRDSVHPYPELALWNGVQDDAFFRSHSMNLETVFDGIRARGARLNIVLGDCCNTDAEVSRTVDSQTISFAAHFMQVRARRNYRQLLMEAKGSYIACAAQKGESAACNKYLGGFFTFFLMFDLNQVMLSANKPDPQNCWNLAFQQTRAIAAQRAANTYCHLLKSPCRQNLLFKNVKPASNIAVPVSTARGH